MQRDGDDVRARINGSLAGDRSDRAPAPLRTEREDGEGATASGARCAGPRTIRSAVRAVVERAAAGYLTLTVVALVVGVGTRTLGKHSWFGAAEEDVTWWVIDHRTDGISTIAAIVSNLSDTWTVLGLASGSVIVLLLEHRVRLALVLVVSLPLELAVFLSVTYLVQRPRPAVETLASVPSTPSFPSGHVTAAVVLYGGLVIIVRELSPSRRIATVAVVTSVLVVVLVAGSRVYEGLHHPTDVLAGGLLGVSCLAVAVIASRASPTPRPSTAATERQMGSQ